MKSLVSFVLFLLVKASIGANILFLNGIPSPSHHIFNRVLAIGLAAKGYNLTFLSCDTSKEEVKNLHYIHLERAYEFLYEGEDSVEMMDFANHGPIESVTEFAQVSAVVCDGVLSSKGLDTLLSYPNDFKFDAILLDYTWGPCLLPLITRFNNPPLIALSAFANPPFTTDYVGGHKYPAYVPHYNFNYPKEMSFVQRLSNTGLYLLDWM